MSSLNTGFFWGKKSYGSPFIQKDWKIPSTSAYAIYFTDKIVFLQSLLLYAVGSKRNQNQELALKKATHQHNSLEIVTIVKHLISKQT